MINHLQLLDLYHSPEILIFVVGIFWLILGKLRLHNYIQAVFTDHVQYCTLCVPKSLVASNIGGVEKSKILRLQLTLEAI